MLTNTAFAVLLYTYLSLVFDHAMVTSWLIGALILLTLYTLGRLADGHGNTLYLEISRATLVLLILLLFKNTLLLSLGCSVLFYVINYALCTSFPYKRTASSF
ncbi:Uncharacterised protein [Legionella pneumophila]|nr:Uncharacterised protein [Legionella pneumophila]